MISPKQKIDLFTVKHFEFVGNTGIASILVDKAHPIFKGHFPDNPIIPGACLVQIALGFIKRSRPDYTGNLSVQNAKFTKLIVPGTDELVFKWTIKPEIEQKIQADISVLAKEEYAAKFKIQISKFRL